MLRYFRSRFCQAKKNKRHQEKKERKEGERNGGNICIKGQSRRVADVNLLHPDEAKSRKGSTGRGKDDRGQYREIGDTGGAWQCVAYYIFLLFIILHKYRSGDAYPRNERRRKAGEQRWFIEASNYCRPSHDLSSTY